MPLPLLANPNGQATPTQGVDGGLNQISNAGLQEAFTNPQAANIANAIDTGFNRVIATQPNQMAASPLAGLTTLGSVANAGTQNAGVAQAGVNQAGIAQAGLAQQGLAQAGQVGIDNGASNALLNGQVANINQLAQQAQGLGPSVAAMQAHQQGEQNVANQMGMLASQRGSGNSALGLRNAMDAKARSDQQVVQASVQGRAAEQVAAQQQLTQALGGTQQQVMQGAQAQAGLTQATNLSNTAAANQALGANAGLGAQQQIANAQFANQQMGANAAAANQVGLANTGAVNQNELANTAAYNTAQLQNSAGQNQAMLQQGQMTQQTQLANTQLQASQALANLQAQQQTQALNAQDYNAMVQAIMASGNNDLTASQNYANAMIQQQLVEQGMRNGLSINAANNTTGLIGAGIAGGAALGAGAISALPDLLKSDIRAKTNIRSGERKMKDFLSQMSQPAPSGYNLWSNE